MRTEISMKKVRASPDDGGDDTKSAMEIECNPTDDSNSNSNSDENHLNIIDRTIAKFAVLIIDHPFRVIGVFLIILAIITIVDAFYFELDSIDDHACMYRHHFLFFC